MSDTQVVPCDLDVKTILQVFALRDLLNDGLKLAFDLGDAGQRILRTSQPLPMPYEALQVKKASSRAAGGTELTTRRGRHENAISQLPPWRSSAPCKSECAARLTLHSVAAWSSDPAHTVPSFIVDR